VANSLVLSLLPNPAAVRDILWIVCGGEFHVAGRPYCTRWVTQ